MNSVLVTGASTGIGRATALALVAGGYRVFAGVRSINDAPAGTLPLRLDVTNPSDIEAVAQRLAGEGLSGVINNAGYNYLSPFEYSDERAVRNLMEVNLFGLYRVSQALLPHLRRYVETHPGETAKLINISSIGGLIGLPWEVFYHASKFAVTGLTQGLRSELWSQGIRVSAVCPGGIRTPFLAKTEQGIADTVKAIPAAAPPSYAQGLRHFSTLVKTADKFGSAPEAVAQRIVTILGQTNPAFRHLVGFDAKLMFTLSRILPQGLFNAFLRGQFAPAAKAA